MVQDWSEAGDLHEPSVQDVEAQIQQAVALELEPPGQDLTQVRSAADTVLMRQQRAWEQHVDLAGAGPYLEVPCSGRLQRVLHSNSVRLAMCVVHTAHTAHTASQTQRIDQRTTLWPCMHTHPTDLSDDS